MLLYHVRHFQSNKVQTISCHPNKSSAVSQARNLISKLEKKYEEKGSPVIVESHSIKSEEYDYKVDIEMFSLCKAKTNALGDHDPIGEGVSVALLPSIAREAQDAFDIGQGGIYESE